MMLRMKVCLAVLAVLLVAFVAQPVAADVTAGSVVVARDDGFLQSYHADGSLGITVAFGAGGIGELAVDQANEKVWVARTDGFLQGYDANTGALTGTVDNFGAGGIQDIEVNQVTGDLYVLRTDGLLQRYASSGGFLNNVDAFGANGVVDIQVDESNNSVWIGRSDNLLQRYDGTVSGVALFSPDNPGISRLEIDLDTGNVWNFRPDGNLFVYDNAGLAFTTDAFTTPFDMSMDEVSGNMWITRGDGLIQLIADTGGAPYASVDNLGGLSDIEAAEFDGSAWVARDDGFLQRISTGGTALVTVNIGPMGDIEVFQTTNIIPEPSSMVLLWLSLVSLVGCGRRRKR